MCWLLGALVWLCMAINMALTSVFISFWLFHWQWLQCVQFRFDKWVMLIRKRFTCDSMSDTLTPVCGLLLACITIPCIDWQQLRQLLKRRRAGGISCLCSASARMDVRAQCHVVLLYSQFLACASSSAAAAALALWSHIVEQCSMLFYSQY